MIRSNNWRRTAGVAVAIAFTTFFATCAQKSGSEDWQGLALLGSGGNSGGGTGAGGYAHPDMTVNYEGIEFAASEILVLTREDITPAEQENLDAKIKGTPEL